MIFSNQLDHGEKISVIIRKHWLIYAFNVAALVLAALIPLILGALAPQSIQDGLIASGVSGAFLIYMYVMFLILLWVLAFVSWTTYFLDTWIVTNRRIISIDQKTLFERTVTTVMLEKIQDVTVHVDGVLPTLVGFGTLILHTAGDGEDIVISFAAHPQYAKDRIIEMQKAALSKMSTSSMV